MTHTSHQPTFTYSALIVSMILSFGLVHGDASAAPDLAGTISKIKRLTPPMGERLVVKAHVNNVGLDDTAVPVTASLWFSGNSTLESDDALLAEQDIAPGFLASGEGTIIKFALNDPVDLMPGWVIISIDQDNVVDESDEDNNITMRRIPSDNCQKGVFLVERNPNTTQQDVQRAGLFRPDTCVTLEGAVDQDQPLDRYRVFVAGEDQLLEVAVRHLPSVGREGRLTLTLLDVERGEEVGTCRRGPTVPVYSCELRGTPDRPTYPVDIVLTPDQSLDLEDGAYRMTILSPERLMNVADFTQFSYDANVHGNFFSPGDMTRVHVTRNVQGEYTLTLFTAVNGDPSVEDCLGGSASAESGCLTEIELPPQPVALDTMNELLEVFSRVRVWSQPRFICRHVLADFLRRSRFIWDDFTAFGIDCSVPHVPDDQAQAIVSLLEVWVPIRK